MYVFLQYFDTVGWVFWPVKIVARITYTVLEETLNHALSINQCSSVLLQRTSVSGGNASVNQLTMTTLSPSRNVNLAQMKTMNLIQTRTVFTFSSVNNVFNNQL